jgi:hypothetical protein|tara:strand:- start:1029 stop:1421 length:393 start_codon:yes stop_codon:yes gene_type:complete
MNRREKLLASIIGPEMDPTKAKMLDTTIKFILGDMCSEYLKFWNAEGEGVMVFQPENHERSMFYLTLEELNSAKEDAERTIKHDLVESFSRILNAAQKINPEEKAGFVINDKEGMRYFEIDFQKVKDGNS